MDLKLLAGALKRAPIGLFLGFSLVILIANLAADVLAMHSVFRWFNCRVAYRDLLIVRAATYLLAVINYHVGQAAIIGFLYRRKQVPLLRASGFILFIMGINVGTLFLLASAGALRAPAGLAALRYLPMVTALLVVLYGGALLLVGPATRARLPQLLQPLFEMGLVGNIKGVLVRLPHVFVLIVWYYVSFHLFGIAVTPLAALVYLPAYFALTSLPISPNGIGLPQVVAMYFFGPFYQVPAGVLDVKGAQDAAVMACCLSAQMTATATQLLLGFLCLPRATRLGVATDAAAPVADPRADKSASASASAEA
jgi:hypothetical protein